MELLTQDLKQQFAKQGDTSTKEAEDILVLAKFFCPWNAFTWFAAEWYPDTNIFFGYANLGDDTNSELGNFSLKELEELEGPFGMKVERDIYWVPRSLRLVIEKRGHI
jgi:hypothetical protein